MLAEEYVKFLSDISDDKMKMLKKILVLTETQSEVILNEDIEKITEIVEEKQKHINEINKLDKKFELKLKELKELVKIKSISEIADLNIKGVGKLKNNVECIMKEINNIKEVEDKNNIKIKEIFKGFGGTLNKINEGKKATVAYTPFRNPESKSYFIDKKK